jgi:hypothetical protein
MATQYSFVTIWRFDAPIDAVWDKIIDSESWPQWWKYVQSVTELEPGDENGVGSLQHITWTSALPYKLSFDSRVTRVEKPHVIEAVAMGDLNGTGRWQLSQEGSVTTVRCDWNVSPSKFWMNLLSPVARPIFAWNHGILMNEGGRSLARLLHARLLDAPPQKLVGMPRVLGVPGAAISLVLLTTMMYVILKRGKR